MKIKDGFALRKIDDAAVVVALKDGVMNFDGLIILNESGVFLWRLLEKGADRQQLTDSLLAEYDTDEATASQDVEEFLQKAEAAGVLE